MKLRTNCFVLFCLVALSVGCEADKSSVAADERIGDGIIAALDKFKTEQGVYPDTLTQVVPTYIKEITSPHYGEKRWDYIHYCKNDSFGLAMWGRKPTDDAYMYNSERKKWEVVENSF
jgi:hypothetical protein